MVKVQIIEDESLISYADFDNCEVWLLNRTSEEELDERIVNISELTESALPSSYKFPQLLTEIFNKYPNEDIYDENNEFVGSEMTFSYEILTFDKENFAIHSYVCDESSITTISQDDEIVVDSEDDEIANEENTEEESTEENTEETIDESTDNTETVDDTELDTSEDTTEESESTEDATEDATEDTADESSNTDTEETTDSVESETEEITESDSTEVDETQSNS